MTSATTVGETHTREEAGSRMTAVIFDMDGVLVDGEPLHFAALNAILADEGASLDVDSYRRYLGTTLQHTWDDLRARFNLRHDFDHYAQRYDAAVMDQYRRQARPTDGALALLERLRHAGVPCAVASSSNRRWVDAALDALAMRPFFTITVAGDEVKQSKPHPEIYLAAADQLGEAPDDCLVIEDAPAGIESGRRAGMRVVAVRTEMTEGLSLEGATHTIDSLEQFDLAWLDEPQPAHGNEN
jgi:HAD superfamily hydrolase (TIGR01509 family)